MFTLFENEKLVESEEHLKDSIDRFSSELSSFCKTNDSYDFYEWFSERSYLSLYINGLIRNSESNHVNAIQEYLVKNTLKGGNGRCDALLMKQGDIYLVESKLQSKLQPIGINHWDIGLWENYDQVVYNQLKNYYETEEVFFKSRNYGSVFLQTLTFKIVEADYKKHCEAAMVLQSGKFACKRKWYYGCFESEVKNVLVELYGSIAKVAGTEFK